MKNELLKNIIRNKEEEISVKQKELGIIKYGLMNSKTSEYLNKYTKEEIKAMNDFSNEYLECKQRDINTLKELCNRYKKEYNLEGNKMKLSKAKEIILKQFGERGWKRLKESYEYQVYIAPEEEQLRLVQTQSGRIENINNPTEDIQLEAVEENPYLIKYINNPTDKAIEKAIESVDNIDDVANFLKHIEDDLNEE